MTKASKVQKSSSSESRTVQPGSRKRQASSSPKRSKSGSSSKVHSKSSKTSHVAVPSRSQSSASSSGSSSGSSYKPRPSKTTSDKSKEVPGKTNSKNTELSEATEVLELSSFGCTTQGEVDKFFTSIKEIAPTSIVETPKVQETQFSSQFEKIALQCFHSITNSLKTIEAKLNGTKSEYTEETFETPNSKRRKKVDSSLNTVSCSTEFNKLIKDWIWTVSIPRAAFEKSDKFLDRCSVFLSEFMSENSSCRSTVMKSLCSEIESYGFHCDHNSIPDRLARAILRLRTNERASWTYEVRTAFKSIFRSQVSRFPDQNVSAAAKWIEEYANLCEKLQQPRANGFGSLWNETLHLALHKGNKSKDSLEHVGIESLAMMAIQNYLQGIKKFPSDESYNRKVWKEFNEKVMQDRSTAEEGRSGESDEDENPGDSSDDDPDEMYRARRNKFQGDI